MITVVEQPFSIDPIADWADTIGKQPPVSLNDSWDWVLQPDTSDVITTNGVKAKVEITVPATCTVPSNGTAFTVWGHSFQVDSVQDFTSSTVKVVSIGFQTALNLQNMFQANIFFNRATNVELALSGSTWKVTITWLECREQTLFDGSNMNAAGITAFGGSMVVTQGSAPVYKEGYKITTRFGYYDVSVGGTLTAYKPIGALVGIDVDRLCNSVGFARVNQREGAAQMLQTPLPELSPIVVPNTQGIMRLFSLEYGWLYRDGCIAKSGTIKKTKLVLGLNAAFPLHEAYGIRRYWPNHPNGFPPNQYAPDFLTTQPKSGIQVTEASFCWLYLLTNYQLQSGFHSFITRFVIYKKDGTIGQVLERPSGFDPADWYKAAAFDVSPQIVYQHTTVQKNLISHYLVQVVIREIADPLNQINASEYMRYDPVLDCERFTDVYFVSCAGGVSTLVAEVQSAEASQEGDLVWTRQVQARGTRASQGGRTLSGTRNYIKFKCAIEIPVGDGEHERWLEDFRTAPNHWVRIRNHGNEEFLSPQSITGFAQKAILDAGTITTKDSLNGQTVTFSLFTEDWERQTSR